MEFFEMATLGTSSLGLVDALRQAGDAANANIVEILNRLSPVYRNGMYVECNNGTAHKHTIRTGLPSVAGAASIRASRLPSPPVSWCRTPPASSRACPRSMNACSKIAKNGAALRMSEAESFIEAMAQEIETGFFYHDVATTPEKFKGLAARYGKISGGGAIAKQIIDAGGTGTDNTSIWFVTHSEKATCMLHPRACPPASSARTRAASASPTPSGNAYYVKEELFRQHVGVAVRDWRFNARICNVDVSDTIAGTVDLYKWMRKALYQMQSIYATALANKDGSINGNASVEGRTVIYMNRTILEALDATGTNIQRRSHAQADGARRPHRPVLPRHPDRDFGRPPFNRSPRRLTPAPPREGTFDMILSNQDIFSDAQAITATAASTNIIDLQQGRNAVRCSCRAGPDVAKGGVEIPLDVRVVTTFATLTSLAVSVEIAADGDAAFGSPTTIASSAAIPAATLVAGYQFPFPARIPEGVNARYVRLKYTVAGSNATAGADHGRSRCGTPEAVNVKGGALCSAHI
jgi:hypothetical protein